MRNIFRFIIFAFCLLTTMNSLFAQWVQTNGPEGGIVYALATNSSGNVFAGTYGGGIYYYVANGHAGWTKSNITYGSVFTFAVNSNGYIFAGTGGTGVYRSTDNGANWTQVTNGLNYADIYSLAADSSGNIYAGTFGTGGVFLSTNNGASWTQKNNGLTNSTDSVTCHQFFR